jgi:hypothetical protein
VLRHTSKPGALDALASFVKVKYPVKIRQFIIRQIAIKLIASQEGDISIRK